MNNIKQKSEIKPDTTNLKAMELKANLNPEQREYLDVLKDKMRKVLGNKTKQELAKAGDLVALKDYKSVLGEILEFLRTKDMKNKKLVQLGEKMILAPQAEFLEKLFAHIEEVKERDLNKNIKPSNWIFPRQRFDVDENGNIVLLSMQNCSLETIPNLKSLTELESLYLSGNKLKDLPGLSDLINLRKLDCSDNLIEEMPSLVKLKKLNSIDFLKNNLSDKEILKIQSQIPRQCGVVAVKF